MDKDPRPDPDLEGLDQALCKAFGVTSQADVIRALTARMVKAPTSSRYANVIRGRAWSLDTIEQWCRAAGIRMVIDAGQVRYVVPTEVGSEVEAQ